VTPSFDGVLVVDKPDGMTSHDVVATVRRRLPRSTKVGHTGTLDPFATGVLPVVLGKATRLSQFLTASSKRYEAGVAFGTETDSGDCTGAVVATGSGTAVAALTDMAIAEALT
jgi:tRNA pseudouridine55 synthase